MTSDRPRIADRYLRHFKAAPLAALLFVAQAPVPFSAQRTAAASELTQQGQGLAERLCASCHAVDRGENSPVLAAPAFRRMEPRVDLDQMIERLQDGLVAGHPDMPVFVLKDDEARALVAYMKSLREDDSD